MQLSQSRPKNISSLIHLYLVSELLPRYEEFDKSLVDGAQADLMTKLRKQTHL